MKAWALPAAIIVAVEYAAALVIGWRVGFHYTIPFASYFIAAAVVIVLAFALFIAGKLVRARKGDVPLHLARFLPFAVGVLLVALEMAVLCWTKIMLPIATGFWADPMLASADRTLFGTDPWHLLQWLNGPLIDRTYITWAPIKFLVLTVLVALPESAIKTRALLSYFFVMFAGAIGQYALPSAGPVFHQAIPLQPWVAEAKAYLWQDYLRGGGNIGTGISAMPSVHVAIALWVALVIKSYVPKFAPLGFAWFTIVAVGSVALGWHYAVDSLAAIGIAVAAWLLAGLSPAAAEEGRTKLMPMPRQCSNYSDCRPVQTQQR